MYFGITNVKLAQAEKVNGNPFATSPAKTDNVNMWDKFKAENAQDVEKMSTVDAMTKLNAVNKPQDAKKVKAMEKMSKLSKAMQDKNFLNLTQKHFDAFKLLEANPALRDLADTLDEKLISITDQNIYFIQKLELSSMQDLSADEINKICKDITNAAKQLEKDAQKIRAGILKAGAYSEAMMKLDDPEKKDKYEKLATETVQNLPDAFKNKEEAAEVQDKLSELSGEEETDLEEDFQEEPVEDTELGKVGDFLSPFIYDEDGTLLVENLEQGTFDADTDAKEEAKAEKEADKELGKIRDEYKKDLNEQKEKTGKELEPIKDEKGRILKSLLGEE